MMIVVERPGLLTTVQDGGRFGLQHLGVPPSGPMDPLSFRLANLIAGNGEREAAIEVTLAGPELRFQSAAVIAISGADLGAAIDAGEVPLNEAVSVPRDATLRFGARLNGSRAYIAVRGGIDVPMVLGSRATSLQAHLPGLAGRPLRAGDTLPIGRRVERDVEPDVLIEMHRDTTRPAILRFMPGPDVGRFGDGAMGRLGAAVYRVGSQSNRMGYRLEGPPIESRARELLSEASPVGSIQVPPSGEPILLMADRQTSGGYPRIGTVITADIPVAGQLAPGDEIRFEPCDRTTALAELRAQRAFLRLVGGAA